MQYLAPWVTIRVLQELLLFLRACLLLPAGKTGGLAAAKMGATSWGKGRQGWPGLNVVVQELTIVPQVSLVDGVSCSPRP